MGVFKERMFRRGEKKKTLLSQKNHRTDVKPPPKKTNLSLYLVFTACLEKKTTYVYQNIVFYKSLLLQHELTRHADTNPAGGVTDLLSSTTGANGASPAAFNLTLKWSGRG